MKLNILNSIQTRIQKIGLHIKSFDFERPWGGFFVIDEVDTKRFILQFFPEMEADLLASTLPMSPKILCVAPGQQLSWQYHQRRSEIWKLVDGKAAYRKSDSDEQGPIEIMELDKILALKCGERHRLIGLNEWGIIAEIWHHTDLENPSDEDDIIRLVDDYGR